MYMPNYKVIVALTLLVLTNSVTADDLTIPNAFTAGTPARAADVNGNFNAVEASVMTLPVGLRVRVNLASRVS